jgi:hypothetical protein
LLWPHATLLSELLPNICGVLASFGVGSAFLGLCTGQIPLTTAGLIHAAANTILLSAILATSSAEPAAGSLLLNRFFYNTVQASVCSLSFVLGVAHWRRRARLAGDLVSRAQFAAAVGAILCTVALYLIVAGSYVTVRLVTKWSSDQAWFDFPFVWMPLEVYVLVPLCLCTAILGYCARRARAVNVSQVALVACVASLAIHLDPSRLRIGYFYEFQVGALLVLSMTLFVLAWRAERRSSWVNPVLRAWNASGILTVMAVFSGLAVLAILFAAEGVFRADLIRIPLSLITASAVFLCVMTVQTGAAGFLTGYCAGNAWAGTTSAVIAMAFTAAAAPMMMHGLHVRHEPWLAAFESCMTCVVAAIPFAAFALQSRRGVARLAAESRARQLGRWLVPVAGVVIGLAAVAQLTGSVETSNLVFPVVAGTGLAMAVLGHTASDARVRALGLIHIVAAFALFWPRLNAFPSFEYLFTAIGAQR